MSIDDYLDRPVAADIEAEARADRIRYLDQYGDDRPTRREIEAEERP